MASLTISPDTRQYLVPGTLGPVTYTDGEDLREDIEGDLIKYDGKIDWSSNLDL